MRVSEGEVVSISCRYLTPAAPYDQQRRFERRFFFLFLIFFIPRTEPFVMLQPGPQVSHKKQKKAEINAKMKLNGFHL